MGSLEPKFSKSVFGIKKIVAIFKPGCINTKFATFPNFPKSRYFSQLKRHRPLVSRPRKNSGKGLMNH